MRIVLDTNIVVSALLQPLGPSASIFLMALAGKARLCLTEPILTEYEEVLRRPRLKRDAAVVRHALASIRKAGDLVRPASGIHACSDPDDNIFLECAEAAEADYLITGNKRHFPDSWKKTKILTAREFVTILAESTGESAAE